MIILNDENDHIKIFKIKTNFQIQTTYIIYDIF